MAVENPTPNESSEPSASPIEQRSDEKFKDMDVDSIETTDSQNTTAANGNSGEDGKPSDDVPEHNPDGAGDDQNGGNDEGSGTPNTDSADGSSGDPSKDQDKKVKKDSNPDLKRRVKNQFLFHLGALSYKVAILIVMAIVGIAMLSSHDMCNDQVGKNILESDKADLEVTPDDGKVVLQNLKTDGQEIEIRIMGRYYPWGYGFGAGDGAKANDKECSFHTIVDGKYDNGTDRKKVNIADTENISGGQKVCYLARGAALYMQFLGVEGEPVWYQVLDRDGQTSPTNNGKCQALVYGNACFDEEQKRDKRVFTFVFHELHPDDKIPEGKQVVFRIATFRDGATLFSTSEEDKDTAKMTNAKGLYELYMMRGFVDENGLVHTKVVTGFGTSVVGEFQGFLYGKPGTDNPGFVLTAYRQMVRSRLNQIIRAVMVLSMVFFGFNVILGLGQTNHKELLMQFMKISICFFVCTPNEAMDSFFRTYIIGGSQILIDTLAEFGTNLYDSIIRGLESNGDTINNAAGKLGVSVSDLSGLAGFTVKSDWLSEVNLAMKALIDEALLSKVAIAVIGFFPFGIALGYLIVLVVQKIFLLCLKVITIYSSIIIQLGLLLSFTVFMIPFILFNRTMSYFTNWINKIKNLFIELALTVVVSKLCISLATAVYLDFVNSVRCTFWLNLLLELGKTMHVPPIVMIILIGVFMAFVATNPWVLSILTIFASVTTVYDAFAYKENMPILLGLKSFGVVLVVSSLFDKCLSIAIRMTGGSQSGAASQIEKMSQEIQTLKKKTNFAEYANRVKQGE